MKKNILYILILVITINFLAPVNFGLAADCYQTCVDLTKGAGVNTSACNNLKGASPEVCYQTCVSLVKGAGANPSACDSLKGASAPAGTADTTKYQLLAPLPDNTSQDGTMSSFDPTGDNKIGGYLNLMIKLFIGICAVLSVIMIVIGGIEYMTSELPGLKSAGKERIIHAIFGLILALGAWTLLYTINPDLLKSDLGSLNTPPAEVKK